MPAIAQRFVVSPCGQHPFYERYAVDVENRSIPEMAVYACSMRLPILSFAAKQASNGRWQETHA